MILAIDTATNVCSVAVGGEVPLASFALADAKAHSRSLQPMLQSLLSVAKIEFSALRGIAVTAGPGSFTGLRIGMATAKALAQVLDIPILPVSTLQAMAFAEGDGGGFVCSMLDARHGRAFTGLYKDNLAIVDDQIIALADLPQLFQENSCGEVRLVGNIGSDAFENWQGQSSCRLLLPGTNGGRMGLAPAALALGWLMLEQGKGIDCREAMPRYLTESEPELKRKARGENCGH